MQRESVGLEPVINTYQLPIHSDMNFVNEIKALTSLSDVKTVVLRFADNTTVFASNNDINNVHATVNRELVGVDTG